MMTTLKVMALVILTLLMVAPATAMAQLYSYETPDGELLITTERRNEPGYTLIEELSSPEPRSPSSANSSESDESDDDSSSSPQAHMGSSTASFGQRETSYDDIIREASEAYDVPFGFIKAVIRIESAFQSDAVSHAGAMGLMQLMPRTAESLDVDDAFDARQNIFGGAKFLRILIDRYDGDINLILAAYNAGDVAVQRHDGIPYAQTRQYVASVYYWYQNYSAEEDEQ